MFFWLRNIIISIVLIALAYFLLANQEMLFPTDELVIEEISTDESSAEAKEPPKKRTNSAADGLSKFYANLHGTDDDGPRIINNVVYLSEPSGDLAKILEAKRMMTRPLRKTWSGSTFSRAFRKGETLYQKLSQYAEKEGLEVIWWLDKDYVVKDPFRINHDIIKTAKLIGQAVEGHFMNGLSSYFCYQQRTIVMISGPIPYLDEECLLLSSAY